jgi:2-succinyl-5-enolpyruvyl-6-hydroxy-3-cyclohexene-1-carboxylate synthase
VKPQNYTHYWCAVMVDALIKAGVNHFFVAPGSRSTPLVSALAHNQNAKVFIGIDERCLSFMALGYGKAAGKPGVVVVTSGTAVANLYPAVTESFLSEVPMLLLTADRPYELRDCGANQTMFQANIFGNHINKSFDLAPPSPIVSLDVSLATFAQAYRAAMGPKKGPVHINLQFREPVANQPHPGEPHFDLDASLLPTPESEHVILATRLSQLPKIFSCQKGLLVVGEMSPSKVLDHIIALSEKLKWPIYADVTSNLRLSTHKNILHHFDLALLNKEFASLCAVDAVIKFGGRIVSKRFWSWLDQKPNLQLLSMSESPQRIDPSGRFLHLHVPDLATSLQDIHQKAVAQEAWFDPTMYQSLTRRIDNFLEQNRTNEGYYAARLVASICEPVNLFVSSSMPIRDVDQLAKPTAIPISMYANRGASGIDGVMSSATGVAIANNKPTILLIGDVAFLHDTNGLMLLRQSSVPMLVVVFNNGGGGIFHFLPIAAEPEVITPYLDTPHDVSISSLCQAHTIHHERVVDPISFDDAMKGFIKNRTTRVIEVMIDRAENVRAHQGLYRSLTN